MGSQLQEYSSTDFQYDLYIPGYLSEGVGSDENESCKLSLQEKYRPLYHSHHVRPIALLAHHLLIRSNITFPSRKILHGKP